LYASLRPPSGRAEVAVVGSGVAGLTCALRLATAGLRVVVLEQGRIGEGSTLANHGIVHSGAFYASTHPVVARLCRQAREAWMESCPDSRIDTRSSWYLTGRGSLPRFVSDCAAGGIEARAVCRDEVAEQLSPTLAGALGVAAVEDLIVSAHDLSTDLARRCLAAGVGFALGVAVHGITPYHGRFVINVGTGADMRAEHVVVCAGLGTLPLLNGLGSAVGRSVRSRLSLMVALPDRGLNRPVFSLMEGGPTVAPTTHGTALLSRHGARERSISGPGRRSVPVDELRATLHAARTHLHDDVLDWDGAVAYVCTKTELAPSPALAGSIYPSYAVIDHARIDGIPGLWTVLPGKMTLALHASRDLQRQMGLGDSALALDATVTRSGDDIADMISNPPWRAAGLSVAGQAGRSQRPTHLRVAIPRWR
jgi:glycine/D-amino acid oxidase-like deaminating enzyme